MPKVKTSFTPGPWKAETYAVANVRQETGYTVKAGDDGIVDLAHGNGWTPKQVRANARLIAAAPELHAALVACEDLLADLERGGAENPELAIARAALAKVAA